MNKVLEITVGFAVAATVLCSGCNRPADKPASPNPATPDKQQKVTVIDYPQPRSPLDSVWLPQEQWQGVTYRI